MRYICFAAMVASLWLQAAGAAAIHGVVKDPSGAVVSGAAVELREVPGPGSPKTARTDSSGAFHFNNLPGSHYRVTVTQAGFKTHGSDVSLEGGKDATLEITLALAESRESVSVAGGRRQNVDPVYRTLRDAAVENVFAVENLVLKRDAGVITLKKGSIGFTAPQM